MLVPSLASVSRHHPTQPGDFWRRREDRARVTVRAKVLAGVETRSRHEPEGSGGPTDAASPLGLGSVLDNRNTLGVEPLLKKFYRGCLAIEMNRDHRTSTTCDHFGDQVWIDEQGIWIHINEYGSCTRAGHRFGCGNKGVRGDYDLVARINAY